MTDHDNFTPQSASSTPPSTRGPRRWLAPAIFAGALALGLAGYAAVAATDGGGWRQGVRLAMVQHMVTHALDSVGASAEQENKVHDIVAAKFAEIAPDPAAHAAMRKQALALLAAPTIDRAEVEKLRAQAVATFDAKSKALVGGIEDIAEQLTPAQRAKLAAEIETMPHRGPMMGPWGGHHGPMFGPPDSGAE